MTDDKTARVKWATTAGDFVPFTALSARYHGRTVALVIVEDEPESEIEDESPDKLQDGFDLSL